MPVQTTEVILNRTFYTAGAYIPDPPNSLYYTTGESVEITSGAYAGLYTVGTLTESPLFPQLYDIPQSGRFARTTNITDYSVAEDATTLNPGTLSGGTAQITVSGESLAEAEEFFTASLQLLDSLNGEVWGTVRGLTLDDTATSVTADSLSALFNVVKALPTVRNTLQSAVSTYLNALGISINVRYLDGLGSLQVKLPAQEGNVWESLKQVASAYQFEIGFVGGAMEFRLPRKTTLSTDRATAFSRDINAQDVSQKVRVHYYQNEYATKREVYPVPDQPADRKVAGEEWEPSEPTIYTVDANETVKFTVDMQASLTSVQQPQYISFVNDKDYSGTNGVYSAVGNDDLPITPAQWKDQGGLLSVRLLENQRQIEVTIVGPNNKDLAPYRIAMSSGDGNYYNSLHLTGTGLFQTDDFIDLVTGATNATTTEEIGLEVTNPYIDTLTRAYNTGQYAAASKALQYSVSSDGYLFLPGSVAFGKVGGARVLANGSVFRVDTANTGAITTAITASQDVIIEDINERYAGMTMGEVSALWSGRTMLDFSLAPVRNG